MQRYEGDGDGRGRQQQDPDPALNEGIRSRRRPQPQEREPTARANQRRSIAAHAARDPLMAPGGDGDARDDREQRPNERRDPAPVDRVLEEKRRSGEQCDDADREQPALAEPLIEFGSGGGSAGGGRVRGFGDGRERGVYDWRAYRSTAARLWRGVSDECQAADNVFERRDSTFELLDGLLLLV